MPIKLRTEPVYFQEPEISYKEKRKKAYGSLEEQLEFITENGLQAWQDKVAQIKQQYPKE